MVTTVIRFAIMWYMMSYFKGSQQPANQQPGSMSAPLYRKGDMVDMYVFLSESPVMSVADRGDAELIWQTEVSLAVSPERTISYEYQPSQVRCCLCARGVPRRAGMCWGWGIGGAVLLPACQHAF